jgi:hypothetical protein
MFHPRSVESRDGSKQQHRGFPRVRRHEKQTVPRGVFPESSILFLIVLPSGVFSGSHFTHSESSSRCGENGDQQGQQSGSEALACSHARAHGGAVTPNRGAASRWTLTHPVTCIPTDRRSSACDPVHNISKVSSSGIRREGCADERDVLGPISMEPLSI